MLALLRGMAATLNPQLEMVALDAFPLRAPISKRTYTCLRLRSRSGATGYGEGPRIAAPHLITLRGAIQGKDATARNQTLAPNIPSISMAPPACEGPIGMLASLHVDASIPTFLIHECCGQAVNGKDPLPEKPGLGYPFAGTRPLGESVPHGRLGRGVVSE